MNSLQSIYSISEYRTGGLCGEEQGYGAAGGALLAGAGAQWSKMLCYEEQG